LSFAAAARERTSLLGDDVVQCALAMAAKDAKHRPERIETDSSLRAERDKTDEHLAKRASTLEAKADQVVELARGRADHLLEAARHKVDETLRESDGPPEVIEDLSATRATEDHAVIEERAAADDVLETERTEYKQALSRLLALEREQTDERLLTERARSDRAVASRDDFLAIVSHDVRGILGGMVMSTDLLTKIAPEGEAGERPRQEAQRIRRLIGRMNRLIGDLLDVVSMETGKLNVLPTEQDATLLLTEIMESFQLIATARNIQMCSEVESGELLASFDHDRILQVLTNLVGNAMKFTKPGGAIWLRLETIEGGIQFTVRDSGCGIASDQIDAIFGRFSQVIPDDRRGLGLGLYIARCIIDAHGGKIWATSEPGKGSAFHFTLPGTPPE
jgi:signal transduction histidine kinase